MSRKTYDGIAITNTEFFKQACRWADSSSVQTASKWWTAFVEVIVREMYYNGTVRLPDIGTFNIKTIPESVQVQKWGNGVRKFNVPEHQYPTFTPHDDFINDINMNGVTKAYRKRLKTNKLSKKDMARKLRAELIMPTNKNEKLLAQKEKAQEEFKKYLNEKKNQSKGRVEPEDDGDSEE